MKDYASQRIELEKIRKTSLNGIREKEKKEIQALKERYSGEKTAIQSQYAKQESNLVLQNLKADYSLLKTKGVLQDMSEPEKDEVLDLYDVLRSLDETTQKTLLKNLKSKKKKSLSGLLKGPKIDFDLNEEQEIYSFMSGSGDKAYLVAPIKNENENSSLTQSLEDKILKVLD